MRYEMFIILYNETTIWAISIFEPNTLLPSRSSNSSITLNVLLSRANRKLYHVIFEHSNFSPRYRRRTVDDWNFHKESLPLSSTSKRKEENEK